MSHPPPPTDLAAAFAYYTEAQLATVEGLRLLKRPPKGELRRHEAIAAGMIIVCKQHDIKPITGSIYSTPRLRERLADGV